MPAKKKKKIHGISISGGNQSSNGRVGLIVLFLADTGIHTNQKLTDVTLNTNL